jgi:hypothetical protein
MLLLYADCALCQGFIENSFYKTLDTDEVKAYTLDMENLINSQEAARILSYGDKPISRQRISQLAKKYNWERHIGTGEGCPWLYVREEVEIFSTTRKNGRPAKVKNG